MTNKLMALQNSQFVENRVQEDDDCLNENKKAVVHSDKPPKEVSNRHFDVELICLLTFDAIFVSAHVDRMRSGCI